MASNMEDGTEDISKEPESQEKSKFAVIHKKGDLFSCDECDSLAHCVSQDLRMGKGIATLFRNKFGGIAELKAQGKGVGEVAILHRDKRYVYYLITKPQYFHKPTYSTLEQSLVAMREHSVKNGVTGISMPKIGCGLDKLQWPNVEALLKKVFDKTDIKITVYSI